MRVLRSSYYTSAYDPPTIALISDRDANDSLESIRVRLTETSPRALVLFDLFEMPDGDEHAMSMRAAQRARDTFEQEKHQAMLYFWIISQWQRVKSGGTLLADRPAPMAVAAIRVVLDQLAHHPDYRDQTFMIPDREGTTVTLEKGVLR